MRLFMPVEVWEETDAVRHHQEAFQKAGRHALIVTGRHSSRKNGSLQDVLDVLSASDISYTLFDAVRENPSVDSVVDAAALGLREGADFVIGIGGGSPMDAAKAVALLMAHPGKDAAYLYEKGQDASHLPVILVPTTCGTGSEVTAVSVLTRKVDGHLVKGSIPYHIFADTALVDGKYLAFATSEILCNTAIDALCHLWESAVNHDASSYSMMFAEEGLRTWAKNKDLLTGEPSSLSEDERLRLMHASALAGMAIAQTATAIPHALSYTLTADAGIAHGRATGYFQAGYLAQADERTAEHLLQLAGFSSLKEYDDFYHSVCRIGELPESLLKTAVDAVAKNPAKLQKAPFGMNREKLMDVAFWRA